MVSMCVEVAVTQGNSVRRHQLGCPKSNAVICEICRPIEEMTKMRTNMSPCNKHDNAFTYRMLNNLGYITRLATKTQRAVAKRFNQSRMRASLTWQERTYAPGF